MDKSTQTSHCSPQERRSERGAVMAITAISMLAILLAAGLAIDISHLYNAKAELQNAADASAMAAATQLNSTSGGIRAAVNEATTVLNNYDFKNGVTIPSTSVTFATNLNGSYVDSATAQSNPASIRFVKVTIPPKPVDMIFASLVIGKTQNLTATATAGMSVGLTMNKFYTAYTFIENAASPLQPSQVYSLNGKAWNDSTPNSYRVLAGPGGDLITTGTIHAYGYAVTGYTVAQISASEMIRYCRIGTNTRFGDYSIHPNANPIDEPPDTITRENITYQQYRDLQGNGVKDRADGVMNRRIMTLPIATSAQYNTSTRVATSNRLAAFFIRRKVGTDGVLEVEYIGERFVVPVGTFQPGSVQSKELSITVLYK
jgi:Flp pilus assembly protein TadG